VDPDLSESRKVYDVIVFDRKMVRLQDSNVPYMILDKLTF